MCISLDHVGSCAAQMERSSSRVFQPSPEHVANEKQVVFGLLKQHVPTSWIKAILADGCDEQKLFHERTHVADSCQCLLKELVQVNPYLKKTSIEGALLQWDDECEQKLHRGADRQWWAKQEAYALKECMVKALKAAHNVVAKTKNKDGATPIAPKRSHLGCVVKVLLDGKRDTVALDRKEKFVDKHKRLLRRRSSLSDSEVLVVSENKFTTPSRASAASSIAVSAVTETMSPTTRREILAKYGVVEAEEKDTDTIREPDGDNASLSPASRAEQSLVIDLTGEKDFVRDVDASREETKASRSKMYFDAYKGLVVRSWVDGLVEEAVTTAGENGFVVGKFEDGMIFTTEIPNVCWQVPQKSEPVKKKRPPPKNKQ